MKLRSWTILWLFIQIQGIAFSQHTNEKNHIHDIKIKAPEFVIGEPFAEIQINALNRHGAKDSSINGKQELKINGELKVVDFIYGKAFFTTQIAKKEIILVNIPGTTVSKSALVRYLPRWLSIVPPLVAILLALVTREVIISLFISIFFGALILKGFSLANVLPSLVSVLDTYILNTLTDLRHLSVIIFSFLVGGMVSVISHNGGIKGIVSLLSGYAHSARSSQLFTFFLSFGIFYDNYSNNLIVGNAMRPVTDKYKVSRQKLNFIVHGTAASVTAIAFVTTWIGAELGYINDSLEYLGIAENTYSLFLKSLQFAYYPILMLFFIFFLIWLKKDFGPMNLAEIETRNVGIIKKNPEREEKQEIGEDIRILKPIGVSQKAWLNAALPIIAFICTAFISLLITGARNLYEILLDNGISATTYSFEFVWSNLNALPEVQKEISLFIKIGTLITHSDFYLTLLWSAFAGVSFSVILAAFQKNISLRESMKHLVQGFRLMLSAVIILIFAWSLADVMHDLHTADYINSLISSSFIFPQILPAIIFVIAALISFGTGSVYGTMAILYPLLLPLTWIASYKSGLEPGESTGIFINTISVIITGAVLGNHCSPISDTTMVSSISSDCDPVAHIKTQVPYALTVGGISLFLLLFSLAGFHWSVNYLIGITLLYLIVKYFGKRVE